MADLVAVVEGGEAQPQVSQLGWTRVGQLAALAYTKRSMSDALADLSTAGVLHAYHVGNALHYRLLRKEHLAALLGTCPDAAFQPWPQRLAVAALLSAIARTKKKSDMIQSIELRKTIDRHRTGLAMVGEEPIVSNIEPSQLVERWLIPLLAA